MTEQTTEHDGTAEHDEINNQGMTKQTTGYDETNNGHYGTAEHDGTNTEHDGTAGHDETNNRA